MEAKSPLRLLVGAGVHLGAYWRLQFLLSQVSHKVFGSHWSGRIVYIVGGFLLRDKAPILPRSLTTAANEEPRRAQPPDEVIGGLRPLPPRKRSSSEEDGGA